MKTTIRLITLSLLVCLLPIGSGCIMDEKVFDIVIKGDTSIEFSENHTGQRYTNEVVIEYGEKVDEILEENGLSRQDMKTGRVLCSSYGVTSVPPDKDWEISGSVSIAKSDSTAPLFVQPLTDYAIESVQDALGQDIPANMDSAGAAVINTAIEDFTDGFNPVLVFTVDCDYIDPPPTPSDPVVFDWYVRITLHVVVTQSIELPDLFR